MISREERWDSAVVADTAPESRDWAMNHRGADWRGARSSHWDDRPAVGPDRWEPDQAHPLGCVVGALFGSSRRLEHAGRRLTRRDLPGLTSS